MREEDAYRNNNGTTIYPIYPFNQRFRVVLMKTHGYGKVWRAIEELYPTEK